MKNLLTYLKKPTVLVIAFYILVMPLINFSHHRWLKKDGVVEWDVKHYYAYLPAAIVHGDLSLEFMEEDYPKHARWIWPIETPTGKKGIVTTMGLAFLYLPFFLIGHLIALLNPNFVADGYSLPYHVALAFSAFFYFVLSLFVLRRFLLRYFKEKVTAITLFAIGFGTNLFHYVTYDGPLTHSYSFVLIVLYIYFLDNWFNKGRWKDTVVVGLIAGLVALIRPTDALILILIVLWKTNSLNDIGNNIRMLLGRWKKVLLMALSFTMVWIPQFLYWKFIAGKYFYFSYEEIGGKFFFTNPQISKILFSYGKGWLVYTPLMLIALWGIYKSIKKRNGFGLPIAVFTVINIYILSSWWCWWFGGSFGQRSFIDSYGLMAIPLAVVIADAFKRINWKKYLVLGAVVLLIAFNQFQIQQYQHGAIHYWLMNKEAYWEVFGQPFPTNRYWNVVNHPDYAKARYGIYMREPAYNRKLDFTDEQYQKKIYEWHINDSEFIKGLKGIMSTANFESDSVLLVNFAQTLIKTKNVGRYDKMLKLDYYRQEMRISKRWHKQVERKAKRAGVTTDKMIEVEAERLYELYSTKYD